jgi:hypothetical protein
MWTPKVGDCEQSLTEQTSGHDFLEKFFQCSFHVLHEHALSAVPFLLDHPVEVIFIYFPLKRGVIIIKVS